jgi:hypothetical protein
MYIALNESELKRIKEVEDITGTDTELINHLIPVNSLVALLDDLLCEYNHKVEELEDLEFDLNNNYTRNNVDEYEEYGVSRNDFI